MKACIGLHTPKNPKASMWFLFGRYVVFAMKKSGQNQNGTTFQPLGTNATVDTVLAETCEAPLASRRLDRLGGDSTGTSTLHLVWALTFSKVLWTIGPCFSRWFINDCVITVIYNVRIQNWGPY